MEKVKIKMVTRNNLMSSKKPLLIASLIAVALILFGILYSQNQRNKADGPTDTAGSGEINLSPPTEQEKRAGDAKKQETKLTEEQSSSTPSGNQKQTATPRIGYINQASNGNIEANGYIAEAIETDGTCTLILEKDGEKVSQSKQAMPDAQSTVCGQIVIERSRLKAGEWKARISYSSSKYQGVSEERTIKVE